MFATFAPHQKSQKQFRGFKSHFVDAVSRFDVIMLPTGATKLPGMFFCSVCARSFVHECPMMTQIRFPLLNGLFCCLVDTLPICSAGFLLRTVLSRGFG